LPFSWVEGTLGGVPKTERQTGGIKLYALAFGLFLGLCIWKFGNPVILDHKIATPATLNDLWTDAWPTHWANWILGPLAACGALLILVLGFPNGDRRWPSRWLWVLPLIWLGWQFLSAGHSQYTDMPDVIHATLWQFGGCVACYFLGFLVFGRERLIYWVLAGTLAGFAFTLVRGVDQHRFEYPANYQALVDGERTGWTNFPPAIVAEMRNESIIITTNGAEMANPTILSKFARGRICGTLVYPNALAELILLLWPVSLALAFGSTRQLRPVVRAGAIALTLALGALAFYWTGSKLGWLIGIGLLGVLLFRMDWPRNLKLAALATVLVVGLGVFAVRFHHYFAAGATSVGARFDYWHAAVQTTAANPVFGTGPGTFQRPYAQLKAPESEMARLAHNDYLEQFSDAGIPAGLAYVSWIALAFWMAGRRFRQTSADSFTFAIFLGLLGWFAQGLGEFGLYVPALAWIAFTFLGCVLAGQAQAGGQRREPASKPV
jgi:O-antigen ligase